MIIDVTKPNKKNKTTKEKYTPYILVYGVEINDKQTTQVWDTATHDNLDDDLKDYVYIGRRTLPMVDEFVHRNLVTEK